MPETSPGSRPSWAGDSTNTPGHWCGDVLRFDPTVSGDQLDPVATHGIRTLSSPGPSVAPSRMRRRAAPHEAGRATHSRGLARCSTGLRTCAAPRSLGKTRSRPRASQRRQHLHGFILSMTPRLSDSGSFSTAAGLRFACFPRRSQAAWASSISTGTAGSTCTACKGGRSQPPTPPRV